jgi:P pilus assembly chaperone PapD
MRALFASAVLLSSIAMVPAAFAASISVTGTVKNYHAGQSLTLANGDEFVLPSNFKDPGIKTGEKVKVAYQKTGKKLQAEMVTIVR